MNKYIYVTVIAIIASMLSASSVRAEMPPEHGQGAPDPQAIENHKAEEALKLKNRKEETLLMLDNHMAAMQKKKDCIQTANDMEAMHSCMGAMMGGHGEHGGKEGHMMSGSDEKSDHQ